MISVVRNVIVGIALITVAAVQCSAQSSANPGVIEVDDLAKYSQVLAISDVHGMYPHLKTLLKSAHVINDAEKWDAGKSLMIVVGDSIDKGPASIKVIDLWMKLQSQASSSGGRLIVLLGNHEAEFLSNPTAKKSAVFRGELIVQKVDPASLVNGSDKQGRGNFLLRLPIAARVGKYLFSHSGWYPIDTTWSEFKAKSKSLLTAHKYNDSFITGEHSILEEKDDTPVGSSDPVKWYKNERLIQSLETRIDELGLYGTVMGHQPHAFGFKKTIGGVDDLKIIKIDSGMAPESSGGDESDGEMLRFTHPAELLKLHVPQVERIAADGTKLKIDIIPGNGEGV